MSAKYEFIDAEKAHYPIVKMCAWAEVSTSGFYERRDRPASATARRREELKLLIQAIFDDSDGTYGYRRVHAALARQGERCSPALVRALMRQLGLQPCQPRPWRPTTKSPATPDRSRTWCAATSPPTSPAPSWSGTSPIRPSPALGAVRREGSVVAAERGVTGGT